MNIHKNIYTKVNYSQTKSVALFTNARDEKNIKEWAAHHLLIGFDKIVIFDHKSIVSLKDVFANFDNRIKIIDAKKYESNVKLRLMNVAAKIAKGLRVDWFIYLDADEFLILHNKFIGVKHFLNHYNNAHSLAVNWLFFGSNNHISDPEGLILENYTKSSTILDKHIKSFVRPNEAINAITPHFYSIQNKNRMFGINKILNDNIEPFSFNTTNMEYFKVPAYIAHYAWQSEETYIRRKINLPTDDTGIFRNNDIENIHNNANDNENLYPKNKYAENIKHFLDCKSPKI
jgi:hypothetical protein